MEAQHDARPVRVVVIDDQELVRRVIEKMLGRTFEAVEIVGVGDPSAAIELRATNPDLMIINGSMPGTSGPEVIARVRAFEQATGRARLPMIIESGSPDYLAAGMEAGADASLAMPTGAQTFADTTRPLVGKPGRR